MCRRRLCAVIRLPSSVQDKMNERNWTEMTLVALQKLIETALKQIKAVVKGCVSKYWCRLFVCPGSELKPSSVALHIAANIKKSSHIFSQNPLKYDKNSCTNKYLNKLPTLSLT